MDHLHPRGHLISTTLSSRLVFIVLIGLISIWANQEASRGFAITVINNSGDSLARKRFSLFYQSNDEATRIILGASKIVENIIYGNKTSPHPKKNINHIILQVGGRNLGGTVIVNSGKNSGEFVVNLCPSIMQGTNFREATGVAILRGMARVWLWDGPPEIVDGMVEYIVNTARGGCRKSGEKTITLGELWRIVGLIGRLNKGMKDGWDYRMAEDGIGMPVCMTAGACATAAYDVAVGAYDVV